MSLREWDDEVLAEASKTAHLGGGRAIFKHPVHREVEVGGGGMKLLKRNAMGVTKIHVLSDSGLERFKFALLGKGLLVLE